MREGITEWKTSDHLDTPEVIAAYLEQAIAAGDNMLFKMAALEAAQAIRNLNMVPYHLTLSDEEYADSEAIADGVVIDYSKDGNAIGVEVYE